MMIAARTYIGRDNQVRKRFSRTKILEVLKELEVGRPLKEVALEFGITSQTLYIWKSKYGGIDPSESGRLQELEQENRRLKKMVADLTVERDIIKSVMQTKKRW
jgi:putative transposase